MIKYKDILNQQKKSYSFVQDGYLEHKERIKNIVKYLNKILEDKKEEYILGTRFILNGVPCICTRIDFSSYPSFVCQVDLKPINANDDIGSGIGNIHTIKYLQ